MDAQQLTYPQAIHELYQRAVIDFQGMLCRGELNMSKSGPILQVACFAGCTDHKVDVNVQAIKCHIISVNTSAHSLLQKLLTGMSEAERIAYHDGLLDVSRHYFPFFSDLIAKKEAVLLHKRHLSWRQQKQERNNAIEMLVQPEQVPTELLFEFVACYRKRNYQNENEALETLRSGEHGLDDSYAAYACGYCSNWHIGHPLSKTAPLEYRLSRAWMVWSTQRARSNRFVQERNLLRMSQTY